MNSFVQASVDEGVEGLPEGVGVGVVVVPPGTVESVEAGGVCFSADPDPEELFFSQLRVNKRRIKISFFIDLEYGGPSNIPIEGKNLHKSASILFTI